MTQEQSDFIAQLYMEMYNNLFEYARCTLPNDSFAEEAVQDTFQIACQKPDAVCESPNPRGWLKNTLKYVICNTLKSQVTAKRILEQYYRFQADTFMQTTDSTDVSVLFHDIAQSEDFLLLQDMFLGGKTYLDLAKELGISVVACRKRIQRAREHLQKKLQK